MRLRFEMLEGLACHCLIQFQTNNLLEGRILEYLMEQHRIPTSKKNNSFHFWKVSSRVMDKEFMIVGSIASANLKHSIKVEACIIVFGPKLPQHLLVVGTFQFDLLVGIKVGVFRTFAGGVIVGDMINFDTEIRVVVFPVFGRPAEFSIRDRRQIQCCNQIVEGYNSSFHRH